jgi:hypothetical protein
VINMLRKGSINLSNVVLFMLFFYLIVDTFNAMLIRDGLYSVSAFYKAVILLLIAFIIRNTILLGITLLIVLYSLHVLSSNMSLDSLKGINYLVKFLSIVMFFEYFRIIISRVNGERSIYYISLVCFSIIAINLTLGLLNYGFSQYGGHDGIGSKGFIYSGNELSATLLASASIVLMYYIKNRKFGKYFSFGLVFIFFSMVSATKVSILSSLIIFVIFPVISLIATSRNLKLPKQETYFAILIWILFPVIVGVSIYYVLFEINLIERLAYFYHKYDLITFILSSRNERAGVAFSSYIQSYTIIELFLGRSSAGLSEMDPLDVLVKYGFVGVFIVYGFFILRLIASIKSNSIHVYSRYVSFMIFLLMAISAVAGHIVFSGMAAPLIGALLSMALFNKNDFGTGFR